MSKTPKKLKNIIFSGRLIFKTCLKLNAISTILNKKYKPYNGPDIEAKPINIVSCKVTWKKRELASINLTDNKI